MNYKLKASGLKFEVKSETSTSVKVKFKHDSLEYDFPPADLEAASDWRRDPGVPAPKTLTEDDYFGWC